MGNSAAENAYDVIVVGAGMGGLTAGALLAKEGKKVLVVEQEEAPGGYVREFSYGPYKINPAIHAIMGCDPAGPLGQGVIDAVLEELSVRDRCEFITVDPFYRAYFPDMQVEVPLGREAYLDAHLRHFPDEAEGLRDLVELCAAILREFMGFPAVPGWHDWLRMPFRSPKMFRNATATLAAAMDRHLSDPRLKAVYATLFPYLGLPPSRLSFLLWAVMMASFIEEGAYYCVGGFQSLADAVAAALTAHGGELLLDTRVDRIVVEGGRVRGVALANGQQVAAQQVIANGDARQTFGDLIDQEHVPGGYLRKMEQQELSIALVGVLLATDLDVTALGVPKVNLVLPWDLDEAFASAMRGDVSAVSVHVPTVVDPGLAPPGEHLVIVQGLAPAEQADLPPAAAAQFADGLLEMADAVLPGLRDHVLFAAGNGEGDDQPYPLHRLGPVYGWANTVQQAGPRRLPYKTPVAGLYLAGQWTQPGCGVWTVMLSGINAARYVLGKNMAAPIWPLDF